MLHYTTIFLIKLIIIHH